MGARSATSIVMLPHWGPKLSGRTRLLALTKGQEGWGAQDVPEGRCISREGPSPGPQS